MPALVAWRLALGGALDSFEAFGYYGLFVMLPLVVLPELEFPAPADLINIKTQLPSPRSPVILDAAWRRAGISLELAPNRRGFPLPRE